MNASNSISTYLFAEKYLFEELLSDNTNFILANFTTVAETEDFLNLSSEEVKMWISRDEINVTTEEDVFKIILTWIDGQQSERKKYIAELFREVRLVFVSHDYLHSDIMTNVLVNDNEGCMDLVKHAVKIVNSEKFYPLDVKPRTSLEIPVIVVHMHQINICYAEQYFYYPRQDTWSPIIASSGTPERAVSCHGRLYFF